MKVIQGTKDETTRRKQERADRRKARYREIMLEGTDPQKVIHAAVRWYGMRAKWETESQPEFILYTAMLKLIAQEFSAEWVERDFPPCKNYKGARWGAKDYFSSKKAVENAAPFAGDEEAVNSFLWDYDNDLLREFVIAGLFLLDELRAAKGETSLAEAWADEMGVQVAHSTRVEGGKEILLDDKGRSLGVMKKPRPRHLRAVRG